MLYKSLLKRIVPFGAALVLGLFAASFFVAVSAPNFEFKRREFKRTRCFERQQLRMENQRLRDELRFQRIKAERNQTYELDRLVPPPPPLAPAPPSVPHQRR